MRINDWVIINLPLADGWNHVGIIRDCEAGAYLVSLIEVTYDAAGTVRPIRHERWIGERYLRFFLSRNWRDFDTHPLAQYQREMFGAVGSEEA
jgi:hypothetical protein